MMYKRILVRYGDLTLKGKNRKIFVDKVHQLTKEKLNGLDVDITRTHDRMYLDLNKDNYEDVKKNLGYVSGILSFSPVIHAKTTPDLSDVLENAIKLIQTQIKGNVTFKVESKRADKSFPHTSQELSKIISGAVLKNCPNLKVDVRNPECTLKVELRPQDTYLYLNEEKALGGFPVGVAGKGLLMLSGGIDSPVAGFMAMKQGVQIECIHFESTPLTSIESAQKVVDLTKKMAKFAPKDKIVLHMVPFKEIHMEILNNVPDSYNITIMRRMMYRLAHEIAEKRKCFIVVNGESIGQVASQTLGSMRTINCVSDFPVIRPLATYDKNDIIKIARDIDTYDLSIKPFEDCCTVYLPKNPSTSPKIDKCLAYEKLFDYESLIKTTVENTKSVEITKDSDLDLSMLGLEVRECLLK